MRRRRLVLGIIINAMLLVGLVIVGLPYWYTIVSSFKPQPEIWSWPIVLYPKALLNPALFPEGEPKLLGFIPLYLANYRYLLQKEPFLRWYANTGITTSARVVLSVFLSSLGGFAFAKYDFRFKNVLFLILLASLMLPFEMLLIPLFVEMTWFKWLNSYIAIIAPGAVSAYFIFLMRQYMLSVPNDMLDAARIDGCSEFGLFWRIAVPIQRPAFAVVGILAFTGAWNDYLWPVVVLTDKSKYLLNVGLSNMQQGYDRPYGAIMAGSMLATLPVVIVFLILQRQFIAGLTTGAIKGS